MTPFSRMCSNTIPRYSPDLPSCLAVPTSRSSSHSLAHQTDPREVGPTCRCHPCGCLRTQQAMVFCGAQLSVKPIHLQSTCWLEAFWGCRNGLASVMPNMFMCSDPLELSLKGNSRCAEMSPWSLVILSLRSGYLDRFPTILDHVWVAK